jgi:hypothetical protein
MKKIIGVTLGTIGLLFIIAVSLPNTNTVSAPSPAIAVDTFIVTERFAGTVNSQTVTFEHTDFTRYRLTIDDIVTEGELNTERGFDTDEDATVFVLDWRKPESEQTYFVRLTDTTSLQQLDSARLLIPNSMLEKE